METHSYWSGTANPGNAKGIRGLEVFSENTLPEATTSNPSALVVDLRPQPGQTSTAIRSSVK